MLKLFEYQFYIGLKFEQDIWGEGIVVAETEDDAKQKVYEEYAIKENDEITINDIDVWELTIEGYSINIEKI